MVAVDEAGLPITVSPTGTKKGQWLFLSYFNFVSNSRNSVQCNIIVIYKKLMY